MKKNTLLFMLVSFFANAQNYTQNYTKLHDFNGIDGSGTNGSLSFIFGDSYLYGTTPLGGTSNKGTIFKIKPDGTDYVKLYDFTNTLNGIYPKGSLYYEGSYFYGVSGGGYGNGTFGVLYKIKPDGTNYTKLYGFINTGTNSAIWPSPLISDGVYLYGITVSGGLYNIIFGTIYRIKPDGTNFSVIHSFDSINGYSPSGSLMYDGNYLYGVTSRGGMNQSAGVLYRIKPDGTNYAKLYDFSNTDGSSPGGVLISDSNYLYGVTLRGGAYNLGVIYKIKPDGTSYVKLYDFPDNGLPPFSNDYLAKSNLCSDGTYLYGTAYRTASQSYTLNLGVLYRIKTDGTNYGNLFQFDSINGMASPNLYLDGIYLYGTTAYGGINNKGVIYKYNIQCVPLPSISITSNTTTICSGEAVTFSASGASTYMWSTGATAASITASPAVTALYGVTGTDSVGCTNNNIILISVLPCTGIEEVTSLKSEVKSYPNPANTEVYFDVPNEQEFDVEIYNTLGQLVLSKINYTRRSAINISALNKNLYFYKIKTPKNNYTGKFVKD